MAVRKKTTAKKKTTTRKTTVRKTAAKKTTKKVAAKRTAPKRAPAKKAAPKRSTAAVQKSFTKSQILSTISENCDLTKKQVTSVMDELAAIMERHLKRRAVGEFSLPGLLKCRVVRKPATKARKGINPFTGEPTVFKAKPARNVVKVRPLKKLKEMAS